MNKNLSFWVVVVVILLIVGSFAYVILTGGTNAGTGLASLKASCIDSDGGKNYAVQGTVSKGVSSSTDSCTSTTVLKEYHCYNNAIKSTSYTCTSGYKCLNGACVPSCVPATCSGLGKNCGIWNNNCGSNLNCGTCSTGQNCSNGVCTPACIPATCPSLGKSCNTWEDGCGSTINCGACNGDFFCSVNGQCMPLNQTSGASCITHSDCSTTEYCVSGTCFALEEGVWNDTFNCVDSDGQDSFINGLNSYIWHDSPQGPYYDGCLRGNTAVQERYCIDGHSAWKYIRCEFMSCINGACQTSVCTPKTCSELGNCGVLDNGCGVNINCGDCPCTDTDGGQNLYVKGALTSGYWNGTDSCFENGRVLENWCSGTIPNAQSFACPNGTACSNGACVY